MENNISKRNWWAILVVGGILAIAVILIQQNWLPDYDFGAFLIAFVILAIAFYWTYTLDKQELWWALLPALVMVAILITGIVGNFTPKDASGSSPYAVIALGLCAVVIGLIFERPRVKIVMYIIAIFTFLVGILMFPLDLLWKIILIVVEVLVIGYLTWQTNRRMTNK